MSIMMQEIHIPNPRIEGGEIYGILSIPNDGEKHPAVIISHGYNGSHATSIENCRYYASKGIVALAFDFAGGSRHSRSTGKSVDMSLLTEKDDLHTVVDYVKNLDCINSKNIFLQGESQGGLVSALLADEIPDEICGMILYYPAFCIPDDWRKNLSAEKNIPETMNFWGLDLGRTYFETAISTNIEEDTGHYAGPVLIVHGSSDSIVPLHYAQEAEERFPNASLVIIDGEGHGFSYAANEKARDLVAKHVSGYSEK